MARPTVHNDLLHNDSFPKKSFKDAMTEFVEAPDPLLESVVAYHEGAMNSAGRAAFEARLEDDSEARELLAELRSFEAAETEDGELGTTSEFEVAATLRDLRRRSEQASQRPTTTAAPGRRSWVAAAALVALSLGLGGAWLETRRELMELRSGATGATGAGFETAQIHHLTGGELRSSDEPMPSIQGGTARQVLAITPSQALEAGQVLSCFVTAADSDEPLVGPFQVAATEHGILLLSLERHLPSTGEYDLHLADPASGETIESFRFHWSPAAP